ncbi:MAG TPA: hypothetical protein VFI70_11820 [Nitrososphaeraceae archaeon]|nr:hypothetical protein [Nitrososphaeraceae archaeon]
MNTSNSFGIFSDKANEMADNSDRDSVLQKDFNKAFHIPDLDDDEVEDVCEDTEQSYPYGTTGASTPASSVPNV